MDVDQPATKSECKPSAFIDYYHLSILFNTLSVAVLWNFASLDHIRPKVEKLGLVTTGTGRTVAFSISILAPHRICPMSWKGRVIHYYLTC